MDNKKTKRVIVAHAGKQHSLQLAEALEREGVLYKYITTVYDKPRSITSTIKGLLKGKDLKKASGRHNNGIPNNKVELIMEWGGLLLLLLIRLPKKFIRLDYYWCLALNNMFSKKVGKYALKHDVDAVILFDSMAEKAFEIIKKKNPNITCIMDVSIATRQFMKHNFEKDPGIEELKYEHPELWNDKLMRMFEREIKLTDKFIVASNMSRRSLNFCGVQDEDIFVVPYGVNLEQFNLSIPDSIDGPLRIIYVGQVSYRKGIHHLLNIIKEYRKDQIEVHLCGTYRTSSGIYKDYSSYENIHFDGFVTRDILASMYQNSDVFVFPTIGEGYGLVVLEALSCGVPVVCSDLAGGDDAIINGVNGFVFEGGNDVALKDRIDWCLHNRDKLFNMRKSARESVLSYTWDKYSMKVSAVVERIINSNE